MLTPWLLASFICTIYLGNERVVAFPPTENFDLEVIYEWKYVDYDFGSKEQRSEAVNSGRYIPANNIPIDVDQWRDQTFITIIRDKGVPSTLNVVSTQRGEGGPLLQPYPNWNWTKTDDCSSLISVYRVAIDECDRLWVLDTGIIGDNAVCSPKLVAFHLSNATLIKTVEIPRDVAVNSTSGKGLLVTPIVQTFGPHCEKTYVYMADVEGYAILLYDSETIRRFQSASLVPDPQYSTYTIERESFELEDGPVGICLSPLSEKLFGSPMSSANMFSVPTNTLRQAQSGDAEFTEYKNVLTTQSSAKAMSNTGTLFMGLVNSTAIACWQEFRPLTKQNIAVVYQNAETLQFVSGMKVKTSNDWFGTEKLMVLTNRFQKAMRGTYDFGQVNFRVMQRNVLDMIRNTPCAP